MDIGQPTREVVVNPLQIPSPHRVPLPEEEPVRHPNPEPIREPEREPEKVET